MTTHGNLNQITRGVIRRIDGWIGAISNRTVRYLPISGMKLLFLECFCTVITLPYLTLPTITCFSFHDIYLTCHGFMGCFVLVTEGRRVQQRQKAHNNTATATMTLKQHFFSSFYKTVRNLHWVSLLLIIAISSRLDKNASKKNKQNM